MTVEDYMSRIKKAANIERLSDLALAINEDPRLSNTDRLRLNVELKRRMKYFAVLSQTP